MIFGNLGVRLEFLRYQWDRQNFSIGGEDTGKVKSHDNHVRAGLVIKLN